MCREWSINKDKASLTSWQEPLLLLLLLAILLRSTIWSGLPCEAALPQWRTVYLLRLYLCPF